MPAGLFVESFKGSRPTVALLTSNPSVLTSYAIASDGSLAEQYRATLTSRCRFWATWENDGEGNISLLGLAEDGDTLIVARRHGGAKFAEQRVPLSVHPQRLIVADIDNDRRKEILLFGKSMAGVQVLQPGPGEAFTVGPLLFQDVSAVDIAVADLNGDGIADVFLANWLSNKVAVFFGIAHAVFSEQLTIDLEGEPSALAITPVSRRRTMQLAITLPRQKRIAVFSGNGAGEFRRSATIVCPIPPAAASFVDLNGDPWPDILAASERGILTITGRSSSEFDAPVTYGVGNIVDLCRALDIDGDKKVEIVCADRKEMRLLLAMRAQQRSLRHRRVQYLTGERPTGLALADLNMDGTSDIIVANTGSSSLSAFLGDGEGGFSPQIVVAAQEGPTAVQPVDRDPQTLVVTHAGADRLSVISLTDLTHPSSFSIPTASDPAVLHVLRRPGEEGLRILVRSRGGRQQSTTFSVFEQLTGKTFLEKSFQASLPTAIRSLTTSNVASSVPLDLVLLTYERTTRKTIISYVAADQDLSYKRIQPVLSVPDSTSSFRSIQAADIDNDGLEDLLLVAGQPRSAMGIAFTRSAGVVDSVLLWLDGGIPRQGSSVVVDDLDGDGNRDIAFLDQDTRALKVFYGKGHRRFESAASVAESDDAEDFVIGSLKKPGVNDLVLSHPRKGYISILFAPFER
jgi:hypothetical protein